MSKQQAPAKATATLEVVLTQMRKLKVLRGFPYDDKESLLVIANVLQKKLVGERAHDHRRKVSPDEQVALVVDYVVEHHDGWRGPVQLIDAIDRLFGGLGEPYDGGPLW